MDLWGDILGKRMMPNQDTDEVAQAKYFSNLLASVRSVLLLKVDSERDA